jgi:hypothetical protein
LKPADLYLIFKYKTDLKTQGLEDLDKSTSEGENKIFKPMSILVAEIANITSLTTLLESIVKNKYEIKIVNNIQIKIQSKTFVKYTLIIKELQKFRILSEIRIFIFIKWKKKKF